MHYKINIWLTKFIKISSTIYRDQGYISQEVLLGDPTNTFWGEIPLKREYIAQIILANELIILLKTTNHSIIVFCKHDL